MLNHVSRSRTWSLLTLKESNLVKRHTSTIYSCPGCVYSAHGKITPEGVVGIGRAFLGAGARSVLVSLWAVNDEATMEFMKSFYEHLARGHSASLALNWAMKCLRESEKYCAVKHWAPFILIGDDVTIEFGQNQ